MVFGCLLLTSSKTTKPERMVSKSSTVMSESHSLTSFGICSGKNEARRSVSFSRCSPMAMPMAAEANVLEHEKRAWLYSALNGAGWISPITVPWRITMALWISVWGKVINESKNADTYSLFTPACSGATRGKSPVWASAERSPQANNDSVRKNRFI